MPGGRRSSAAQEAPALVSVSQQRQGTWGFSEGQPQAGEEFALPLRERSLPAAGRGFLLK